MRPRKFASCSPLKNCAGAEKAAGMSSVAAGSDDSNVAEPQLDSGSHCHGGALAEVGGLGEEPGEVGVVVEEQAAAAEAEDDRQGEDALAGVISGKEESDKKIEGGQEKEIVNADAGNSSVVKELLTDLLHKVGEEDSAEESDASKTSRQVESFEPGVF